MLHSALSVREILEGTNEVLDNFAYLGVGDGEEMALNGFPDFLGTWHKFWYPILNIILQKNLSCPI